MEYYHTSIITNGDQIRVTDLSKSTLLKKIVIPYRKGKDLFLDGTTYKSTDIEKIRIRKTNKNFKSLSDIFFNDERNRRSRSSVLDLGPYRHQESAFQSGEDVLDEFIDGPAGYEKYENLDTAIHKVETKQPTNKSNKVFIVHGHNEEMKQSTARFLEKLDLEAIILHEQPNGGRTIIEKFTDYSDVGYAIILLSADDKASKKDDFPENSRFRARQNVILELGYFLGKLGRNKVVALYEKGKSIEIPGDIDGLLYIPYSQSQSWQIQVAKEMKYVGFEIDMEKLL